MKKLNYSVMNLDAVLVALPKGTGMRQEVPSAIAAMFPQNTDLCPLRVDGKSTWAFGYIKHMTMRMNKGLIHLLTKRIRGTLNGKFVWRSLADGVCQAEFLGARVILFQNPGCLPTVLHMTCPECGQTAWYESDQSEDTPQFVCACCGAEAFAEQMGVFVGSADNSDSTELDNTYMETENDDTNQENLSPCYNAAVENILDVIESALSRAGYRVMDGDHSSVIIRHSPSDSDYSVSVNEEI